MAGGDAVIDLTHPLSDGSRTLALRPIRVRDVIAAGSRFETVTRSTDVARHTETIARSIDPAPLVRLLAGVSGLDEAVVESLHLADLGAVRVILAAMLGSPVEVILDVAAALVLDAEWRVSDVHDLTLRELHFWFHRAVDRAKQRKS